MNSNHPALISGGLFFVIGLALAAALFTGLLPHCWHNGPSVCYWMTRAAGGASAVVAFLGLAMMFSRSAGAGFGMAVGVFLNAILIADWAVPESDDALPQHHSAGADCCRSGHRSHCAD